MGWEKRRYYTRSKRVDGRVVREYVGAGVLARREAERDQHRRAQRAAQVEAWRAEMGQWQQMEQELKELDRLCSFVMRAQLEAAGYHQHDRGAWRKRRG